MEQTSSAAFPNVLVLEYLRKTGQAGPKYRESEQRAVELVRMGYQQLIHFQRSDGGFNWWGDQQPGSVVLTALGLQQFTRIGALIDADDRIAKRAREYLLSKQTRAGSWAPDANLHAFNKVLGASEMTATAYVTWSLLEAHERGPAVQQALAFIESHLDEAKDNYTLALAANAFALDDPRSRRSERVLSMLADRVQVTRESAFLPSSDFSVALAFGNDAQVATSAMAAAAFILAGNRRLIASKLLRYLASSKSENGSFGSTQATVLALRALILAAGSADQRGEAKVSFRLNGNTAGQLQVTPDNWEVTQTIDMQSWTQTGKNHLELGVSGKSRAELQIVARHYVPAASSQQTDASLGFDFHLNHDRVHVGQRIEASAVITNAAAVPAFMLTANFGIPPGMSVDGAKLDELVRAGHVARWELRGRELTVFLHTLPARAEQKLSFALIPRMPFDGVVPPSSVFEYYAPSRRSEIGPIPIVAVE